MKKKFLLLTFMVLMGAMSSWAGQVILDPEFLNDPVSYHGNIFVDNDWPAPGATVTLHVDPQAGYCLYISDIVIDEYDANDSIVGHITPSGPPEAFGPEVYTFQMPTDATHNVQVAVMLRGMEYPVNCMQATDGTFCVSHINGIPIDPDIWNNHARTGDTVTLTATPDPGWELVNYSVFAPNLNDYVQVDPNTGDFIMPPSPVDIQATFRQIDYTINIDLRNGNGSIDVSVIAGVNQSNYNPPYLAHISDLIELMISPDPDYELDFIDIEAEETTYNRQFSGDIFDMPPSNITLVPTFRPVSYMVEIDQGPHGTIAALNTITGIGGPGVPTVPAEMGQNIQLSNTPDRGYELDHYLATNASNGSDVLFSDNLPGQSTNVNDFNMPSGNVVVTAIFKKKDYKISIDLSLAGGNGTIDVFKIDEDEVPPGTPQPYYAKMDVPIELTITPAPGYELDYIDLVADDPIYNLQFGFEIFDMPPSNITLRPTFRVATYKINVDQSILGGTVDAFNIPASFGGPGVQTVPAKMGEDIQLSNTPNRGYRFDYYIVTNATDGSDVLFSDNNPGYSTLASDFFMPGNDVNVSAVFVPNDYPITLNVLPNAAAGNVNVPPTGVYGDQIPIDIQPNAGYTLSQVYYEEVGNFGVHIPVTVGPPGDYYFIMPYRHVRVTVVFDPDPHSLYVDMAIPGGSIAVTQIDGVAQSPQANYYPVGTGVVVDLSNTPNTGYYFVAYELTSDDEPAYYVTLTTNSFTMPPHDVNVSAKFEPNQHKVVVQNALPAGEAEAWWGSIPAYDNVPRIYNPIDYDGLVQMQVTVHNIGYVFDHYELYDAAYPNGPQLTVTWVQPPTIPAASFLMPDCDVLVVPVFLPINYVLALDMTNWWGGWISAQDMAVVPPMTPIKSGADWYDTPYPMPVATYPNAHIGDVIRLNNGRDWNPIYADITFSYYVLTRSDDGAFIGEMTQSEFTMPPCGVIIGAQFHDDNYGIPPTYPVANWAWVTGRGRVLLHMETWLDYKSKSSPDEEEQDTDLYGFARAVPGEPMHFVVQPNPGYQVKKNDITVRLLDVSQGDGGDEGKVLKEFKGGEGIEIFGPDELVTELTDYYFIFDVPEGVAPYDVKVEIYADFTPVDYTITVDGAIEHGTVEAPTSAKVDEVVTLTVTPEPGYRLESITVTPEGPGYLVTVDQNNQFVMPACNVTVTATFTEADSLIGDVNGDGELNITDIILYINYLLNDEAEGFVPENADYNNDGSTNISDVIEIINYLLNN